MLVKLNVKIMNQLHWLITIMLNMDKHGMKNILMLKRMMST